MPTGMRSEPIPTYHFYIDVDSVYQGACTKVTGMNTSHDTIESWHASKDGDTQWIKQPGRFKVDDVKITCAFNKDVAPLADWFRKVNEGGIMENRHNITVHTFTQDNKPSVGWRLFNCYPKGCKYPDLDATQNQAAMLEVTLAVEKIEFLPG